MSWIKRKWKRLLARILREKATPAFIARGWAIGMFYGCTIPFGFQIILSVPTALILKGSKIGSVLGTLITNHFTIFIIYPFQCFLGNAVLGLLGKEVVGVAQIVDELKHVGSLSMFSGEFWTALAHLGGPVVGSFFIGGAIIASVMTPLTYIGVYRFVKSSRARREERRKRLFEEKKEKKDNGMC